MPREVPRSCPSGSTEGVSEDGQRCVQGGGGGGLCWTGQRGYSRCNTRGPVWRGGLTGP